MARPERFELPTLCFEGRCSIQLSYGRMTNYRNPIIELAAVDSDSLESHFAQSSLLFSLQIYSEIFQSGSAS